MAWIADAEGANDSFKVLTVRGISGPSPRQCSTQLTADTLTDTFPQ